MKMRKLGNSGLSVSELCFGAVTFGGTNGIWGKVGRLEQAEADALVGAAHPTWTAVGVNWLAGFEIKLVARIPG